jgi:hypothetical protein
MSDPDTLGAPFEDYQATVRRCGFDANDWKLRSFLQRPDTTEIGPMYESMGRVVKQHRAIALENSWGKRMLEARLKRHEVLKEVAQDKGSSKSRIVRFKQFN